MFYKVIPTQQSQQSYIYSQRNYSSDANGSEAETRPSSESITTEQDIRMIGVRRNLATDRGDAESQRNERERQRVRQVNAAFALLRQHLPPSIQTSDRKCHSGSRKRRSQRTSKLKTLRAAIQYINELKRILHAAEEEEK